MQTWALDWQQGAVVTAALGTVAGVLTISARPRLRGVAPYVREGAIIGGLYSLWQLAGTLSVLGTDGALARARWIERVEHDVHLPSEATVQRLLTGSDVVAQAMNLYYATLHFTGMFAFLIWLFVRHRDRYRPVRRVLALTTLLCLVVQLLPVAPPRLMPGFEDTAAVHGESVYGLGFGADELSAMPSVHVAWAVLVGVGVWTIARGPGRWIGPVHAALTVLVVVATANHWWSDGIVAVAVLGLSWLLVRTVERAVASRRPAPTTSDERQLATS